MSILKAVTKLVVATILVTATVLVTATILVSAIIYRENVVTLVSAIINRGTVTVNTASDLIWSSGAWRDGVPDEKGGRVTDLREFEPLARQGDADAQLVLGEMYRTGTGVPQDYEAALNWYRLAAEQGHASAQNNLGAMYGLVGAAYFEEQGAPQDDAAALEWFTRAAEQGLAQAQNGLGFMYYHGMGVPQDGIAALKWYVPAAIQGHYGALLNLALLVMYYGVHYGMEDWQDDLAEAGYLELAAERGPAVAHYILGGVPFFLTSSRGVPLDDEAAETGLRLARRAAELGYAPGQYRLGWVYFEGQGVPQDYETALRWYTLAAEQGYVLAQRVLGRMYLEGTGVPRDDVYAYMWFSIAALGDSHDIGTRDIIAKRMTPSQLEKAQGLTREWLGSHAKSAE